MPIITTTALDDDSADHPGNPLDSATNEFLEPVVTVADGELTDRPHRRPGHKHGDWVADRGW